MKSVLKYLIEYVALFHLIASISTTNSCTLAIRKLESWELEFRIKYSYWSSGGSIYSKSFNMLSYNDIYD